jgi:hypothetical protein
MAEETTTPKEESGKKEPFSGGKWAYTIVIMISLVLLGLPFLGPLFLVITPILFIISIPALIWFLHQNKKSKKSVG